MTFGIAPFATAPFSAGTVAGDDATITLTGSSLNITLSNSYTVQKTHFVSGFDLTSDTGILTPKLAPNITSNAVTSAVGSVGLSAALTASVAGTSSTLSVGTTTNLIRIHEALTGVQVNLSVGTTTLSAGNTTTVTGNAVTSAVGTTAISSGITIALTGNAVTSTLGTVTTTANALVTLTGNSSTITLGTVSTSADANVAVTGTSSTLSTNNISLVGNADVAITGTSSTITLGALATKIIKTLAGNSLTSAVGTVVPAASHTIAVTGISSSLSVGTVAQKLTKTLTGNSITPSVGTVIPLTGSTLVTQGNLANTNVGPSDQTFAITVAVSGGINVFYVDGVAKPVLELVKGKTYTFDQSNNTNSGHPLIFASAAGSYTSGVTVTGTAGQPGAKVTFVVPQDAPYGLAYACSVHGAGMGNILYIAPLATVVLKPNVVGQSLSTSVNGVSITLSPVAAVTGELIPIIVNPLSVFTWSAVNDTTTGGNSWTDVSTTGAGTINPEQKVA